VVTFEVIEDDYPKLMVVHGGANEEVFHRYRLDIPEEFLFQLADQFIAPLRDFRQRENAARAEEVKRRQEQAAVELNACAFRAGHFGSTQHRDYRLIVHRRDCRHALDVPKTKGRQGTSPFAQEVYRDDLPLVNGVRVRQLLKTAREVIDWSTSDRNVRSNAARAQAANTGRVRDTALNFKPLQFCGTCKPLGPNTSALMTRAFNLANMTEVIHNNTTQDIHALFAEIDTALWETEQEHLDTLSPRTHTVENPRTP